MRTMRPLFIALTVALLATYALVATPPAPTVVRHAAPSHPLDTLTATAKPAACEGWSNATAYPMPIFGNAVASLGGYIYSFGGVGSNYRITDNAYKFDGNTWTAIASMPVSRTFASAVTDGRYIYIINGQENIGLGTNTNTLYRYDPQTNTYTQLASSYHTTFQQAAVYANGHIYRVGGIVYVDNNYGDIVTSSVEDYDISNNRWSTDTNYPLRVSGPGATAKDGIVYMVGGLVGASVSNKAYAYDPATDSWSDGAIADLPAVISPLALATMHGRVVAMWSAATYVWDSVSNTWTSAMTMPLQLEYASGAVLNDALYVVGGADSSHHVYATTQRYVNTCAAATPTLTAIVTGTPPTATPSLLRSCNVWQGRRGYLEDVTGNAVVGLDSSLYSFGGFNPSTNQQFTLTAHSYRFDGSRWEQIADLPMPTANVQAVTNGTYIYIMNGNIAGGDTYALYRYDPTLNTYTTLAPSALPVDQYAAVYLNGKIFRIGGYVNESYITSTVEVYNVGANKWSYAASYPTVIGQEAAVTMNGYIYTAGGIGGSNDRIKTYRYDPVADTWDDKAIADLPFGRWGAVSGIYNGEWLIADGAELSIYANTVISWNPATNVWHNLADIPASSWLGGGAIVDNSFYTVGGDVYQYGGSNSSFYPSNNTQRFSDQCVEQRVSPTLAYPTSTPTPAVTYTPAPATHLAIKLPKNLQNIAKVI